MIYYQVVHKYMKGKSHEASILWTFPLFMHINYCPTGPAFETKRSLIHRSCTVSTSSEYRIHDFTAFQLNKRSKQILLSPHSTRHNRICVLLSLNLLNISNYLGNAKKAAVHRPSFSFPRWNVGDWELNKVHPSRLSGSSQVPIFADRQSTCLPKKQIYS